MDKRDLWDHFKALLRVLADTETDEQRRRALLRMIARIESRSRD